MMSSEKKSSCLIWACCADAADRKLLSGDTESDESEDTTRKDTNRKTVFPRLTYEKKGGEDYCKPSIKGLVNLGQYGNPPPQL